MRGVPYAQNTEADRQLFQYDGHRRKAGVTKSTRLAKERRLRRRWRRGLREKISVSADYRSDGPGIPIP